MKAANHTQLWSPFMPLRARSSCDKFAWQAHCAHSLTLKSFSFFILLFLFSGCLVKPRIEITLNSPIRAKKLNITLANVQVINHQIILTGTNLNTVSNFAFKESGTTVNLQIESVSSTTLIANTLDNVTFAAGKIFDLLLSNASAANTFTVNFSLCDSSLGGKGFNCVLTPNDKDVLSYDASTGKWAPRAVNGLSYQGLFDASSGATPTTSTIGDYYIISVAGTIGSVSYSVGDWIVLSAASDWERINNSNLITSIFGRTGVVTANEGDYILTKMGDVDLTTTPPVANQFLKYNGVNWIAAAATVSETDPLVSAFAKAALPTCGAGQVLKGDGTTLTCVADNAGAGTYTGTLNRAVITDGATGALSTSAVTNTELGYLSGVTSALQTQLNNKQATLGTGSITTTEILDGTIADGDLAGSIAQAKITNLTTDLGNKQSTANLAADVRAIALTGLSVATNVAIVATDSILVAFGNLQAQITALISTKLDKTGGTLSIGTIDGVPNPTTANQVANKAYVDSLVSAPTCPTGYLLVPKNTAYTTKDFCVMKYEASNDGYGTATSVAGGTPWVSIDRPTARSKCLALGQGFDLISNSQWQTIARNIAGVTTNWDSVVVASGQLNRGHTDGAPNNALSTSADDVSGNCSGTGQTCSNTVWDSQRRTHVLSNANVIWDIGGNVWEWVTNDSNVSNGANGYISTMNGDDIRQSRYGAAAGTFCASPSSTPYCGMGYGYFNYAAGAVLRGGPWNNGVGVGVFAALLGNASTVTGWDIGFRCAFVP
jgi:hypothetical protein